MSDEKTADVLRRTVEGRAAFEARKAHAVSALERARGARLNSLIAQAEASGEWEGEELRTLLNERIEVLCSFRGGGHNDPGHPDRPSLQQRYWDMVALECVRANLSASASR